jgi:hypothetical protein
MAYDPRSYASSPYREELGYDVEPSQQKDQGINYDEHMQKSVGPSLARTNKAVQRVNGRPPTPAVSPQWSDTSIGVGVAKGGTKPKQPSVGYHRAT